MKTILTTTDFTKSSLIAVHYAANLALATGSKLLVLHTTFIPMVSDSFFDMRITLDELKNQDSISLSALVDALIKKYGPELKIYKKLKVGFVTDEVVKTIKSDDVSLLVMGISHAGKFSEVVFGSTATAIAGSLKTPVLIVPENVKYKPWNSVAYAFDQKEVPKEASLGVLKELVLLFSSKVRFVNVMDNPYIEGDDKVLKPLYNMFKDQDTKTAFLQYKPSMITEIIMDWVRRHKSSALVVVARKHNLFFKLFNERVTKKMAFHSKVPVLVLSEKK